MIFDFEVVDAKGKLRVFNARTPTASLAPVWAELPTGWTSVMCRAVDSVDDDRTVLKRYPGDKNHQVLARLAKAKALGDAMTRMQKENGDVPTHWQPKWEGGCSWWNCLLADVSAMNELDAITKQEK